jgi:hypothetical protein
VGDASDDGTLSDGRSDAGGGAKSGSEVVRSMIAYGWRVFFVWRVLCDVCPESVGQVVRWVSGMAPCPFQETQRVIVPTSLVCIQV